MFEQTQSTNERDQQKRDRHMRHMVSLHFFAARKVGRHRNANAKTEAEGALTFRTVHDPAPDALMRTSYEGKEDTQAL